MYSSEVHQCFIRSILITEEDLARQERHSDTNDKEETRRSNSKIVLDGLHT